MGTVISGAQSVDNNVVPVVSSGKNQSVNGQKFGDIMAKSVGGNAGKKNCRNCTDDWCWKNHCLRNRKADE